MWPAALSCEQASAYCGVSVSTWQKLVRLKIAPPSRLLSPARVGWLRAECDAWLLARPVSDRPPGPGRRAQSPSQGNAL